MGEKKRQEAQSSKIKKILFVTAGILFVVFMILSSMGTSWITAITGAKAGDAAVVSLTFYDAAGNPILTSDQQLFKQAYQEGRGLLFMKQFAMGVNQSLGKSIFPVDIYDFQTGSARQYAIFAAEYDAIASALVGMRDGETKKVNLPSSLTMEQTWSIAQLTRSGVNASVIDVGSFLPMGVSDKTDVITNASELEYVRFGEVTGKTPTGVTVDFGYPTVEIKVVTINNR